MQKSFGKQLKQLAKRELRAVVRDRTTLAVRFCLSVVLTFLFGLVFQGVGPASDFTTMSRRCRDVVYNSIYNYIYDIVKRYIYTYSLSKHIYVSLYVIEFVSHRSCGF